MNIITYCSKKNFAFYKNLCITSKFNMSKNKQNNNNNNNNNNLEDFIEIGDNTNNYKKFVHEPFLTFNNNKQPKNFNRLINTNSLLYKVDQNVTELQYLEQLYEIIEIKELK